VLPSIGLLVLALTRPDVYFEQTTVVIEDGRPAGPGVVSRIWHAGGKMRMQAGGITDGPALVLRLDTGQAWRVEPARRTVVRLSLERLKARAQMDMSTAADLMGTGEDARVRATPGRATRLVAGHRCDPWRFTAGSTVMEVCLASDLPLGVEAFTSFLEWTGADAAMPGLVAELRQRKGFPMETRSRVTVLGEVHETLSTVTRVQAGPIDPALFEPPKGYKAETAADEEP
jgi:hypothetical protein